MFTLRQAHQDKKILDKFINGSEGHVVSYHEEPNWKGNWTVFETSNGPQKLQINENVCSEIIIDDILIFETSEEYNDLYSPFGEESITDKEGFLNGLEKIVKYGIILKKYKSVGGWKVKLSIKNGKPHWNFL
jgi:hypothetical protein